MSSLNELSIVMTGSTTEGSFVENFRIDVHIKREVVGGNLVAKFEALTQENGVLVKRSVGDGTRFWNYDLKKKR